MIDRLRNNVPLELQRLPQWVVWKSLVDLTKPKPVKLPMSIRTHRPAMANNPKTWTDFKTVIGFLEEWHGMEHTHVDKTGAEISGKVEGAGFVFSKDDPYVGIDLDNCITDSDFLQPWAAEIVSKLNGYTEVSPSGEGLHIIVKGRLPANFKNSNVEAYSEGRYFTMTGDKYDVGCRNT